MSTDPTTYPPEIYLALKAAIQTEKKTFSLESYAAAASTRLKIHGFLKALKLTNQLQEIVQPMKDREVVLREHQTDKVANNTTKGPVDLIIRLKSEQVLKKILEEEFTEEDFEDAELELMNLQSGRPTGTIEPEHKYQPRDDTIPKGKPVF